MDQLDTVVWRPSVHQHNSSFHHCQLRNLSDWKGHYRKTFGTLGGYTIQCVLWNVAFSGMSQWSHIMEAPWLDNTDLMGTMSLCDLEKDLDAFASGLQGFELYLLHILLHIVICHLGTSQSSCAVRTLVRKLPFLMF